jgi:hypothetical protein
VGHQTLAGGQLDSPDAGLDVFPSRDRNQLWGPRGHTDVPIEFFKLAKCKKTFRLLVVSVSDCGQLRLNQRNRACQLQVDHHLNAPVELEEHCCAFR